MAIQLLELTSIFENSDFNTSRFRLYAASKNVSPEDLEKALKKGSWEIK